MIVDPPGTIPVFLALTTGRTGRARRRLAWQAVGTSLLVISLFALFGQSILDYLSITVPALQVAGGLLLAIVSLELLTGSSGDPSAVPDVNVALVPLGTPLLAGPGAIVATIVFVQQAQGAGDGISLAAGVLAVHAVLWLALRYASVILRVIRDAGVHLISRIFGLLLSAIAVQLVADGVTAFVRAAP